MNDDLGIGAPPATASTTVDGVEARVTFDGATGAPLLIEASEDDDSILSALAHAVEAEAQARKIANKYKNAHAATKKAMEAAAQHAAAYWARTRQIEMQLTVGGTEPDEAE